LESNFLKDSVANNISISSNLNATKPKSNPKTSTKLLDYHATIASSWHTELAMSFQEPQEQKTEKMMSDNTPDEEQISDSNNVEETPEEAKAHEYVTGLRLFIILAAVTLVFFLLMLDMSIVTNVGPTTFQTRQLLD
jgi:hypothetical protein